MWSVNGGAAENQQEPGTKFPEKFKICSKLTLPKTSWKPAVAGAQSLDTVAMPCYLGRSWANIYGSSVGWLENTRMSMQTICYLYWKESKQHK